MQNSIWDAERWVAGARLVLAAALCLSFLLAGTGSATLNAFLGFVFVLYLLFALMVLWRMTQLRGWGVRAALLTADLTVLLVVVLYAPVQPAAFLVFFVYFSVVAGFWQGWASAAVASLLAAAGYLIVVKIRLKAQLDVPVEVSLSAGHWLVGAAMVASGTFIGWLAEGEKRRLEQRELIAEFSSLLSLDAPWMALWERFFRALVERFRATCAVLVYRDTETGQVLEYRGANEADAFTVEERVRPPRDEGLFLLGQRPSAFWGRLEPSGEWRWRELRAPTASEPLPVSYFSDRFLQEFTPKSILSARLSAEGVWEGRLILLDRAGDGFEAADCRELVDLLNGLGPSATTVLTMRRLIARAVAEERDRLVRELHDSVAQTLASVAMQLTVFRRQAEKGGNTLKHDLARLQEAVESERNDFRRFLRELKPLRVPPEEFVERLTAHCGQFQQETAIEVDLQLDPLGADVPEGISREVFLILREALHNVRKHARAGRVGVHVRQDSGRLRLSIEDNGRGFPFEGAHEHGELEKQGLAPAAILERVRSLGGSLHISSEPERGTHLRMEIPLE